MPSKSLDRIPLAQKILCAPKYGAQYTTKQPTFSQDRLRTFACKN